MRVKRRSCSDTPPPLTSVGSTGSDLRTLQALDPRVGLRLFGTVRDQAPYAGSVSVAVFRCCTAEGEAHAIPSTWRSPITSGRAGATPHPSRAADHANLAPARPEVIALAEVDGMACLLSYPPNLRGCSVRAIPETCPAASVCF